MCKLSTSVARGVVSMDSACVGVTCASVVTGTFHTPVIFDVPSRVGVCVSGDRDFPHARRVCGEWEVEGEKTKAAVATLRRCSLQVATAAVTVLAPGAVSGRGERDAQCRK